MATQTIEQYLPKTAAYINGIKSRERIGHHNYVVIQRITSATTSLAESNSEQINEFDLEYLEGLKFLDTKH